MEIQHTYNNVKNVKIVLPKQQKLPVFINYSYPSQHGEVCFLSIHLSFMLSQHIVSKNSCLSSFTWMRNLQFGIHSQYESNDKKNIQVLCYSLYFQQSYNSCHLHCCCSGDVLGWINVLVRISIFYRDITEPFSSQSS